MEFPSGIVTQIKQVTAWRIIPGLLSLALSQLIFYTFHLFLYYFTFFNVRIILVSVLCSSISSYDTATSEISTGSKCIIDSWKISNF